MNGRNEAVKQHDDGQVAAPAVRRRSLGRTGIAVSEIGLGCEHLQGQNAQNGVFCGGCCTGGRYQLDGCFYVGAAGAQRYRRGVEGPAGYGGDSRPYRFCVAGWAIYSFS